VPKFWRKIVVDILKNNWPGDRQLVYQLVNASKDTVRLEGSTVGQRLKRYC